MNAKDEGQQWQWSKSEGVWLVFNAKSEGFIANSERSAIVACHYLNALQQQVTELEGKAAALYDAIKHGDEVHRAWLLEAIENHFAGKSVPPPRAALTSPSTIAQKEMASE